MPDAIFEHPRLVQVYDALDPDRGLARHAVRYPCCDPSRGFDVVEVRDAPDRPDLEYVFIVNRR